MTFAETRVSLVAIRRYIATLSAEDRDRIVRQTAWTWDAWTEWDGDTEQRCLAATAFGGAVWCNGGKTPQFDKFLGAHPYVATHYDDLCRDYGLARVVRLCKKLAGARADGSRPLRQISGWTSGYARCSVSLVASAPPRCGGW